MTDQKTTPGITRDMLRAAAREHGGTFVERAGRPPGSKDKVPRVEHKKESLQITIDGAIKAKAIATGNASAYISRLIESDVKEGETK